MAQDAWRMPAEEDGKESDEMASAETSLKEYEARGRMQGASLWQRLFEVRLTSSIIFLHKASCSSAQQASNHLHVSHGNGTDLFTTTPGVLIEVTIVSGYCCTEVQQCPGPCADIPSKDIIASQASLQLTSLRPDCLYMRQPTMPTTSTGRQSAAHEHLQHCDGQGCAMLVQSTGLIPATSLPKKLQAFSQEEIF